MANTFPFTTPFVIGGAAQPQPQANQLPLTLPATLGGSSQPAIVLATFVTRGTATVSRPTLISSVFPVYLQNKLYLKPTAAGYTVTDGIEVTAVEYDGGANRYSKDPAQSVSTVEATWVIGAEDYLYFNQFFSFMSNGADPFLIDLLLDTGTLTEYTVHFVPGSISRVPLGYYFKVSATLEVVQPVDAHAVANAQATAGLVSGRGYV